MYCVIKMFDELFLSTILTKFILQVAPYWNPWHVQCMLSSEDNIKKHRASEVQIIYSNTQNIPNIMSVMFLQMSYYCQGRGENRGRAFRWWVRWPFLCLFQKPVHTPPDSRQDQTHCYLINKGTHINVLSTTIAFNLLRHAHLKCYHQHHWNISYYRLALLILYSFLNSYLYH